MHELPGDFRGTHAMNVLQSKLPKYPGYHKSPNHCIKRLFESKQDVSIPPDQAGFLICRARWYSSLRLSPVIFAASCTACLSGNSSSSLDLSLIHISEPTRRT